MEYLSLDTETTGLDPWHGTKPFMVTTCDEDGETTVWEWDVDPLTREPLIPTEEVMEISDMIDEAENLVFQNATFDLKILETIEEITGGRWAPWPWEKIHETQISAHMLASAERRDLTTLALKYLSVNVQPYEDRIHQATEKCRRITRNKQFIAENGNWQIAAAGREDMPSAKGECWKADMWLPRAIAMRAPEYLPPVVGWDPGDDPRTHPWLSLVSEYAAVDAEITVAIHRKHKVLLEAQGVWPIYLERLKVLPIVHRMKEHGISVSKKRKDELYLEYEREADKERQICVNIADNPDLQDLPINGRSNALNEVVFEQFGLISPTKTKAGAPSMDKSVLAHWLEELPRKDKRRRFIQGLKAYRQRKTAMAYMEGYERFWLPTEDDDYYILHPSLHPTGTNTLRWSSSNPNQQNISKKEGFNLRYCFGPAPGRKWASLDYENIELRIPAYESGEAELIELFEDPDKPPYYGSVHLLNFSAVFPDKWEEAVAEGRIEGAADYIKGNWKASWYQRCKNGNFAVQYGSVDKDDPDDWSTADKAYGRKGCHRLLKSRFSKQERLNQHWIQRANRTGYVETMPDIEICPEHGYPLQCPTTWGRRISPTIPLNYHVQGTACWVIFRAMIKVQEYLDTLNDPLKPHTHWHMVMQIHDELVIDYPADDEHYKVKLNTIRRIMESIGDNIGVNLKAGCDLHPDNWSKGVAL